MNAIIPCRHVSGVSMPGVSTGQAKTRKPCTLTHFHVAWLRKLPVSGILFSGFLPIPSVTPSAGAGIPMVLPHTYP
jgi:hypothetical protein